MHVAPDPLANIRFVLIETSHPGNVGASARAIKTMGLKSLALVAPRCQLDATAHAMAAGADDVLAAASRLESLDQVLADCLYAVAATARPRDMGPQVFDARGAAQALIREAARGPVALVFGNETSGLSNDDLRRCHALAHIPVNPHFSSLNLAAAVQVFAYELRMAQDAAIPGPAGDVDPPATGLELEHLFAHAERALAEIGFHDPANPKRLMPRLRRLAARARLEHEEVKILRGMLSWAARARQAGGKP